MISAKKRVIEYATPNESSKAHIINFNNPIVTSNSLDDKAITQKANKNIAGVSISVSLMLVFINNYSVLVN